MTYVLVMVVVFTSAAGIDTDTHFYDFDSEPACETAREGIEGGLIHLKGTLGREVFAACYPKQ